MDEFREVSLCIAGGKVLLRNIQFLPLQKGELDSSDFIRELQFR